MLPAAIESRRPIGAARAIAAGGTLAIPVKDQFYGERSGTLADPFGHQWILATRTEGMSQEEMQRRFEGWLREQGG